MTIEFDSALVGYPVLLDSAVDKVEMYHILSQTAFAAVQLERVDLVAIQLFPLSHMAIIG